MYQGYDVGFFYYYLLASFGIPGMVPVMVALLCGLIYGRSGRALLIGLLTGTVAMATMAGWWAVVLNNQTPGSGTEVFVSLCIGCAFIAVTGACFTWWMCRYKSRIVQVGRVSTKSVIYGAPNSGLARLLPWLAHRSSARLAQDDSATGHVVPWAVRHVASFRAR